MVDSEIEPSDQPVLEAPHETEIPIPVLEHSVQLVLEVSHEANVLKLAPEPSVRCDM